VLDAVEMAYAREVYLHNEAVIQGKQHSLVEAFCNVSKKFQDKVQGDLAIRAAIALYPIRTPVRATIALYSTGRPVRATITLYPIGRPIRATITLYPIGRPVRATIALYSIGVKLQRMLEILNCFYAQSSFCRTFQIVGC